jgi:hypothetical protein
VELQRICCSHWVESTLVCTSSTGIMLVLEVHTRMDTAADALEFHQCYGSRHTGKRRLLSASAVRGTCSTRGML